MRIRLMATSSALAALSALPQPMPAEGYACEMLVGDAPARTLS